MPRARAHGPWPGAAAALVWALAAPASAQETAEGRAAIDPSALGIDLSRIQRGVQAEGRTGQGALNLNVFITVFGEAPPMLFLPQGDENEPFFVGPPADGPPTHADLMRVRTPREFSAPMMDFSAALRWLRGQFGSGGSEER